MKNLSIEEAKKISEEIVKKNEFAAIVIATSEDLTAAIKEIEKKGYKRHHSARERGYVQSKSGRIVSYEGMFGVGYKILLPNNMSSRKSNNYHDIIYFTKQN